MEGFDCRELVEPRRLARIQSEQWWRGTAGHSLERRDLVAAWVVISRVSGHGWVELRAEEATFRGWFD